MANSPKSQEQFRRENTTPYMNERGMAPAVNLRARELQRKGDYRKFNIGLKDIDETIYYYFENVIRPSVIQNGVPINVPVVYGSPERWAAVQKDGFYRDKNGKIQTPLIMFKRESMEKNRDIGNKLDANNPHNIQIFEKKYTSKNIYSRFNLLQNRQPVVEYQGVVMPDYYNLTYTCIVFTDYVEQMNKIVESISYASDSYWGDPEKFNFRAMIDNYTMAVELSQGQDRAVKTTFSIQMLGHIIPDGINAQLQGSLKSFSKAAVKFGIETIDSAEFFTAKTPKTKITPKAPSEINAPVTIIGTLPAVEKEYLTMQNIYTSGANAFSVAGTTLTWIGRTIATPPLGYPALTLDDFQVYINGKIAEKDAITSITQVGSNIEVLFNTGLDFQISATDEFVIIGKIL